MRDKKFPWYSIALHGVLLTSCILILLLARENQRLEERLYAASMAAAGGPEISQVLPDFTVTGLDGAESTLVQGDPEKDNVVLIFTTTCPACQKNVEPWLDLHARFGDQYSFTAVGLDSLTATDVFADHHELPFRVVIPKDRSAFQEALNIKKVPQTLVVGADGIVKVVQPGVLRADFQDQLGELG